MKKGLKIGLVFGILLILTALVCGSNVSACLYTDLIAGQDWENPVGLVSIYTDSHARLNIKYETPDDGWEIIETHVFAGDSLTDVPQTKKGNPKIGHFPYNEKSEYCVRDTEHLVWYQIPLSEIDVNEDGKLIILAHSVVNGGCQEETAWADTEGKPFPGSSWALYLEFTYNPLIYL